MDPVPNFRQTFFEECRELLEAAEGHLVSLESQGADPEILNAIFRAIHSIKGGAGAFSFTRLVAFAHILESLLDRLRNGEVEASPEIVGLLIRSVDALADLVREAETGEAVPEGQESALRAALEKAASQGRAEAAPGEILAPQQAPQPERLKAYRIEFVPHSDLIRHANEPVLLLRGLQRLGQAQVIAHLDALPPLESLDPENIYLSWTIDLVTKAGEDDIRDVFEFVSDDCRLEIKEVGFPPYLEGGESAEPPAEMAASAPSTAVLPQGEARRPPAPPPQESEILVAKAPGTASIRVDTDKLDRLVNLVGELVTTQAMLALEAEGLEPGTHLNLFQALDAMLHHIRDLQDNVMAIRAQPVRSVFARLPKLVRDTAAALGKNARLVMTGEQTEIDKTVIEQLGDPLTHMIRNSVDHGIETPEERRAAGKPETGTVHISAEHRSGRIVITIADDGRGIDRARLLAKARDRGLIPADAQLSEDEIDNLVFLPGLSTAAKVSDISGRGVGMDVVRKNIQALGGRVGISSSPGAGCRFTLSLPLTLAVMDGMIVSVGAESYIVPIAAILESLRPAPQDLHAVVGAGDVLAVRGEYLPLVYLHRIFGVPGAITDPAQGLVVLVESDDGKFGIVVDDLVNQQQVVIKSLEENYGRARGIAAATILGSGRVALILDVAGLGALARRDGRRNNKTIPIAPTAEIH